MDDIYGNYNDNNREIEEEYIPTIDDKIRDIEEILHIIREDASNIYYDVLDPYIQNYNRCQVLGQLYQQNATKFISFTLENNKKYKELLGYLHYLYDIQREDQIKLKKKKISSIGKSAEQFQCMEIKDKQN